MIEATVEITVWSYFQICEENKTFAICNIKNCKNKKVSRGSDDPGKMNTTNLRRHIFRNHKKEDQILTEQETKKEKEKDEQNKKQKSILNFISDQKPLEIEIEQKITNQIALMIIQDMQPYSIVEDQGFLSLLKLLQPKYIIPSRKHFSQKLIPEIYVNCKNNIKSYILTNCKILSCSSDGWSSYSGSSFISFCIHFITSEFERKQILLNLMPLNESQTGDSILTVINQCLSEWDINDSQIACIIHDNAPNMVSSFSKTFNQILCSVHTLQLCLKSSIDGLKRENINPNLDIQQLIGIAKTIISHFNQSTTSRSLFQQNLKKINETRFFIQDISTRWNSIFIMIERFICLKDAINLTLPSTSCSIKNISNNEWLQFEQLKDILKCVKLLCDELESDNSSLSQVLPGLKLLQKKLNKFTNLDPIIEQFKQTLISQIKSRFKEINSNEFYLLSTIIDPRFKIKAFMNEEVSTLGLKLLNQRLFEYYLENTDEFFEIQTTQQQHRKSKNSILLSDFWSELNEENSQNQSNSIFQVNQTKQENSAHIEIKERIQSEVAIYISEARLGIDQDPLLYWKENKLRFPCLQTVALKYLYIPSASAYTERVFSAAGNIVTKKRASLNDENIEILCFLYKNQLFI